MVPLPGIGCALDVEVRGAPWDSIVPYADGVTLGQVWTTAGPRVAVPLAALPEARRLVFAGKYLQAHGVEPIEAPRAALEGERGALTHRADLVRERGEVLADDAHVPYGEKSSEELRHLTADIVRFFLAPARCGMFLSRSRMGQMARALQMRLPFGSRFEVATTSATLRKGVDGCTASRLPLPHTWPRCVNDSVMW